MTAFGLMFGGLSGGLTLQAVEVTTGHYGGQLTLFWFCFSFIFGAIGGSIFGAISGLFSGFFMAIITRLLFQELRLTLIYKLLMGLTTLVTTSYIFWDSEIWLFLKTMRFENAGSVWAVTLVMSVIIAVYVSQIVARKYINEVSVRKAKAKA